MKYTTKKNQHRPFYVCSTWRRKKKRSIKSCQHKAWFLLHYWSIFKNIVDWKVLLISYFLAKCK